MANSYLDKAGLGILWNKIKALIPQPTTTSSENPKMDGTAAIGSSSKYARADHVHPSDTSRVPTTRKVNGKKLSSDINLIAEDIGYDNGGVTTVKSWIDKQAEIESFNASTGVVEIGGYVGGDTLSYASTSFYNKTAIDGFFSQAGTALDNKVDKVEGKDLSTNDFTNALKTKLEGVETGAEANVLEGVQMNSTDLTIDANKKVNIPVFTGATTSAAGTVGLVPAPAKNKSTCFLFGSGYWATLDPQVFYNPNAVRFVFDSAATGNDIVLDYSVNAATTTKSGVMSSSDKAKLDSITMTNGVIDSSVLPSFVDDVIEAYPRSGKTISDSDWLATGSASGTVITPESGKIYILMEKSGDYGVNSQFRWGGSTYVEITNSSGISSITKTEINAICV